MRGIDVESGLPKGSAYKRRTRRRSFWRLPLSIGLSALFIFAFFALLGSRRSNQAKPKPLSKSPAKKPNQGQPTLFTYEIIAEFPHDAAAFTQGLQYTEACSEWGKCAPAYWESTGLNGKSTVREVDLATGKVLRSKSLPSSDFGEGLTQFGDSLYQILWKTGKGYTYKVDNFEDSKQIDTGLNDGWGITSNGTHLIVGDSTDTLYFIDPKTFETVRTLQVTDGPQIVKWLNELEWIDGLIYANIYQTECIAQIDPNTGTVVGWMDLEGLRMHMIDSENKEQRKSSPDVLNGIAWDGDNSRLFVTGKLWPKLYQIETRPMYLDSKATDVAGILNEIRAKCIIDPKRQLGK